MAIHSSIRVWKIPWTKEPGGLQSMRSQRVDATEKVCICTQWCSQPGSPCRTMSQWEKAMPKILEIFSKHWCAHVPTKWYLIFCDPVDYSPPCSSVHGIFQTRVLKWVVISHSRGSSRPRDRNCISCVSCIGRQILYHCATWEAQTFVGGVQLLSHVQLFVTPWTVAPQASLSTPNSHNLLKLMSIGSVMPSNHLSSDIPFSSCLQFFPASWSFLMSQLFASGGQSTGVSTSASVLPMNIQDWFPLGLTGWISLQSREFSRVFSNTTVQKHQFLGVQPSLWSSPHIHTWLLEKP